MLIAVGSTSIALTLLKYIDEVLVSDRVTVAWTFQLDEAGVIYSSPV